MSSLAIVNAGLIASEDLARPVLEGNCVLVEDGKISEIGDAARLNARDADTVIDAAGSAVMPGLIDSHFPVVIGEYQPRQKVVDFTRTVNTHVRHILNRTRSPTGLRQPPTPPAPAWCPDLASSSN